MLENFKSIVNSIVSIGDLYKKNKLSFFLGLIILLGSTYYNLDYIKEKLGLKEGIAETFLKQTHDIERELDNVRFVMKSDIVNIADFQNGEVTLSRTHLLRWTLLYQSSEIPNNWKYIYYRRSAAPYTKLFDKMYEEGFVYIEDTENAHDVLIRNIYTKYKIHTILYIPMFKNNKLVGFATCYFKKKTHLTEDKIQDYIRLMDVTEALL